MKPTTTIFAVLSSVSLAVAGELGGPKDEETLSRGPLPIHQLPECWQGCLQSENHLYPPNINKVSVYDFCMDKMFHMRFWSHHALASCTLQVQKKPVKLLMIYHGDEQLWRESSP
ncbi:hypothetical protein CABS01_10304 [Colletotrichum abscissum]|uniref:uncharacterized protein n=1 Tax=Colletotrichum abscissum TaxID=1671311 RepID=UPI0027D755D1|nr:uncharacterized protein CABS01_10304 [Colletotrichum abscissum]KAI3536727.1 hypothetical protein CSPX01_10624 [Colletotrichum filicis]KAK1499906.1 hypothetical protein CABS01_10304 [Colletotrichum abscissum]